MTLGNWNGWGKFPTRAASGPSSNILIFWHTPWGPLCIFIFQEFLRVFNELKDLVPCFSYCNYHRETSEQQKQRTIYNSQGIHRLHKNDLQISFCQKKTFGIKEKYVSSIKKLSAVPVCMPIMGDCIHTNCRQAFQIRPLASGFIRSRKLKY